MSLTPGRFAGRALDLRATTSQRGLAGARSGVIGGTNRGPAGIPNIQYWFDAADTTTITESSGAVSQWNDISGNAFHATQATAVQQPTTGSTTQNGLNVINFTGGAAPGSAQRLLLTATAAVMPVSMFCVGLSTSLAGNNGLISTTSSGGIDTYISSSGAVGFNAAAVNTVGPSAAGAVVVNTAFVWVLTYWPDLGRWAHRVNGVETSGSSTVKFSGVGTTVFGFRVVFDNSPLKGWIGECGQFNRTLSLNECQQLEQHLNAKWAVY